MATLSIWSENYVISRHGWYGGKPSISHQQQQISSSTSATEVHYCLYKLFDVIVNNFPQADYCHSAITVHLCTTHKFSFILFSP